VKDFFKSVSVNLILCAAIIMSTVAGLCVYSNSHVKIPFTLNNKNYISKNYIVGMVAVIEVGENPRVNDGLFVVPPTLKIADAALAAHCMWERINLNAGRGLRSFFRVYADGHVDTDVEIRACYKRENVPAGAKILFSDEKFKFIDYYDRNKTVQRGIYIYEIKSTGNCKLPIFNQTEVYQIAKNGQSGEGDGMLFVQHNRMTKYNVEELYSNIESSDEIDYSFYEPLA
jgi:hypothetical protein